MIPFLYLLYLKKPYITTFLTNRAVVISKDFLEILFQSTYLLTYQRAYNLLSKKIIIPLNLIQKLLNTKR